MRLKRMPALLVALVLHQLIVCAPTFGEAWHSMLDRPDVAPPILLTLGPTFGGSPDWGTTRFGYSGAIIFHPAVAAQFMDLFYDADLGFVLDWEWRRLAAHRTIFAGGPTIRWYLRDARKNLQGTRLFVGLGGGLASVTYPVAAAAAGTDSTATVSVGSVGEQQERWVSALLECGYEISPAPSYVIVVKAQWRNYIKGDHDYSNWTLHLQIGVPLP